MTRPVAHWHLTRRASTLYEARRYREALKRSQQALTLAPRCPLVLWDHACILDMLGRRAEAKRIFRRLIRRGAEAIAVGPCGEGLAWARGLVADCHFRLAGILLDEGRPGLARRELGAHRRLRGPGSRSIYDRRDVERLARRLPS
jgi:tetratricopeptide (TPR) repeat protein